MPRDTSNVRRPGFVRNALRIACVVLTAATLGGCIFVPVGGPYYHHPRYYYAPY